MSVNKFRNALIVIGLVFLLSSLSSATWAPQEPGRPPTPEEVRKQMLERLLKQAQESQKNPGQATSPAPAPGVKPGVPIPPVATAAPQGGKVQINYENADLYDFISEISNMLGLTPLVVDSEVKGSVNIISTGPMSKEDVLPLFNLILKNNNAALIRQGDVYQIVPISSALKRGVEVVEPPTGTPSGPSDVKIVTDGKVEAKPKASATAPDLQSSKVPRLVTNVIRVEFVPVKDLIEPIKMFMTEGGVIMPYERLNMLIVTDYTDSAARIMDIIHMLDNSYLDPNLVDLIKIKNNASADVAEDLKKIFGSGAKDSATGISFVSLDRLNAIFVIASSNRGLEEIRHWIGQLDAESGRNIQTYVYVVENSTASQIAMMLSALYGGEDLSPGTTGTTGSDSGSGVLGSGRNSQMASVGGTTSSRGRTNQVGSSSSLSSQSYNQGNQVYGPGGGSGGGFWNSSIFGGGNQRLGPQLNVSRNITSQILRGGEFTGLQDTVRLVVDDVNNSIIIQSTAADYAYILETIKKMDVLPRQAIIDARIYEVDLNDDLRFGVNAYLQAKGDTSKGTTMTLGSLQSGLLSLNTFAMIGDSRQLIMNIEALRNKTKVKVLEAPSILALDGMQASINVGAEYPYPGGSYISSVGGSASDIQYRETGVTLLVLPRISASGSVTMDITQEVSSAGASVSVGTNESAPTFPKALVTTTCYVKDGETVAIAGLIRDSNSLGRRGIPLLSDIPIFGSLFGVTTRSVNRTELIVLITPRVLRSHDDLHDMTQELKDSLRNARKLVDDTEKLKAQDLQDAAKDREKQESKQQEKSKSAQPNK